MSRRRTTPNGSQAMIVAAVLLAIAALYFARAVILPLALAALLSFLLAPLAYWLERVGLHRVPSVILVTVLSFTVIGAVGWLVAAQSADLAQKLPRYRRNIIAKAHTIRDTLRGVGEASETVEKLRYELTGSTTQPADDASTTPTKAPSNTLLPGDEDAPAPLTEEAAHHKSDTAMASRNDQPVKVQVVASEQQVLPFLRDILGPLVRPLMQAGIVIVFVVFMLVQREDLRDRLIHLIGYRRILVTTEALDEGASRISRYLLMQLILNGSHGAAVAIGLAIIGLPNTLLWGLLSALLRFIPYIGPWMAAVLPVSLSLAIFDGWTQPLMVIGLFVVIELISNNVMEPWLYGSQIGASPLAIIVSAAFWTWLWGGLGLVLSTPMTVCLVVVGKYVPQLAFFDILLSNETVLKPHARLYQRLVANDRHGARRMVEKELKRTSLQSTYDSLILPALHYAERDRRRRTLDQQHAARIHALLRSLIEQYGNVPAVSLPESDAGRAESLLSREHSTAVVCVPAHDTADELTAIMLAQLLRASGFTAAVVSAQLLSAERVSAACAGQPDLICICGIPPSTVAHARYLFDRVRIAEPELHLLVGLWGTGRKLDAARRSIGDEGNVTVTDSVGQAHDRAMVRLRMIDSRKSGARHGNPTLPAVTARHSHPRNENNTCG